MKKLLIILAFVCISLGMEAQTQVVSTVYYANERISTQASTGEQIDKEMRTVEFIVVGRSQVIMHTSTSLEAFYLEEGNKERPLLHEASKETYSSKQSGTTISSASR